MLQTMLESNCDRMNRVDRATYTNIISKWVKAVRENVASQALAPTTSLYASPQQQHLGGTSLEVR